MVEGPTKPTRRSTDIWRMQPIGLAFIALTALFVAVLIALVVFIIDVRSNSDQIENLGKENSNRITDIQASRVASCKETYEAIRDVILETFVPEPPLPPELQARIVKFNTTIDTYQQGCGAQSRPK